MKRFLLVFAIGAITSSAQAETKRVRVPVSSLPRQDETSKIDAKDAVLPDGAREGGAKPSGWRLAEGARMDGEESSHCTDGRRGSVSTGGATTTSTEKIWETNGKVFFDRAHVEVKDGKLHVVYADRTPVVYVSESIWAYRRRDVVYLVTAHDFGVSSRAIFWGCLVGEHVLSFPAGATTIESSPEQVDKVTSELAVADSKRPKPVPWKGVAFRVLASVSKASANLEPMLNLVIDKP